MTGTLSASIPNKYRIPLFLVLIAGGLAGNYFRFSIFLNIDFLFGSLFAMLALQFFGLGRGICAAAAVAGYTYFAWNHPYAIIIMTAEVATVGWLMERRKLSMVMADTLYWLVVGMPLVYLFYHLVMHAHPSNVYIVMTKQAMNGIANALVARLIFTALVIRRRSQPVFLREIIANLLVFFVMLQALLILATNSRKDFTATDRHIRAELIQDSHRVVQSLESWMMDRKSAILNLAEMAATSSPRQMQPYLELIKKTDDNFLLVGLQNREATTTAIFPLTDNLGKSGIGINYADRPYITQLKGTLKPMLSEMVMRKIGTPVPMTSILAPVITAGEYNGYIIGVLSLEHIKAYLDKTMDIHAPFYSLLDKNGAIIMTNRTDQKVMAPFVRGTGTLNRLDEGISQWLPALPANTPASGRWTKSLYVVETTIGASEEWKLILEQPVAPFYKALYNNYTDKLIQLFLIVIGVLVMAEFLSRRTIVTLNNLSLISHDLPHKIADDSKQITWPDSSLNEVQDLIENFREMADALSVQFIKYRQINESLEQQVHERTSKLSELTHELNVILDNAPVGILKVIDRKQVWVNRSLENMIQFSKEELDIQAVRKLYPSDTVYEALGRGAYPVLAQGLVFESVQELIRKDGARILVRYIGKAIDPSDMSKGAIWLLEDVTESKQNEEKLQRAHHLLQTHKIELEMQNKELRRTQFELDSSRARYFELYDLAPVGYLTLNEKWEVLEANITAATLLGLERGMLVGQSFTRFILPDDQDICYLHRAQLLNSGTPQSCELRMLKMDGSRIWTKVEAVIAEDKASGKTVYRVVVSDITERKKAEEEYYLFFNIVPDLACIASAEGYFKKVNWVWEMTLGISQEELLTTPIIDLVHPEDRAATLTAIEKQCAGEEVFGFINRYRRKDGTYRWLEWVSVPSNDRKLLFAAARDITERRAIEIALRTSDERLSQAMAASKMGAWDWDLQSNAVIWSPECHEIVGLMEFDGAFDSFAELLHPEDKAHVLDTVEKALKLQIPYTDEFRIISPDGEVRWLSNLGQAVYDNNGVQLRLIGTVQDVTERKRMENEVRQALETARNTNETMSRLLRILAHEFRTPLGLLTISADILDRYRERLTKQEHIDQTEQIRSAANQLGSLVNSVISFNEYGTDGTGKLSQLQGIGRICHAVATEVETVWATGHKYTVSLDQDCCAIMLDETLFRRILENLLTNAFRYTPSNGSVSLHVTREESRLLVVEVTDTGIGIPEADLKLIFDAFYRSANVEGRRGLGLGLSIVHESLTQLGGTITVTSKIGAGTTMHVEIPVVET